MLICLQTLAAEDDRNRFQRLYERYNKLMFYVAHRILAKEQDVEDAVHQAYIAILENMHKIGDLDSAQTKAYVVIVTEHKAIDILRQQTRIVDIDFEDAAAGLTIPPPESNGLAEAIAQLPARYREALMLRYYMCYSTPEVAQLLGMRPESAKRLLSRAKKRLEERMNERAD